MAITTGKVRSREMVKAREKLSMPSGMSVRSMSMQEKNLAILQSAPDTRDLVEGPERVRE